MRGVRRASRKRVPIGRTRRGRRYTRGTPIKEAVQQYLDSVEAGNSRKNLQSTLATWRTWLREERGVTSLEDLDILDCRRYARHLKQRARGGDLKASSATT